MEREKDKLERKQRKLLEVLYADAIPLNLFKEEQSETAAQTFLGGGLHNRHLVDTHGLEPWTSRV